MKRKPGTCTYMLQQNVHGQVGIIRIDTNSANRVTNVIVSRHGVSDVIYEFFVFSQCYLPVIGRTLTLATVKDFTFMEVILRRRNHSSNSLLSTDVCHPYSLFEHHLAFSQIPTGRVQHFHL
ncbi:hypothetical protein CBL_04231 [Carabus blaptoides fortunei]